MATSTRIANPATALAAASVVTVFIGAPNKRFWLRNFRVSRTAGTGANFRPRLHEDVACADEGIGMIHKPAASALVAVQYNPLKTGGAMRVPFQTDADGCVYIYPGFDAADDNAVSYIIECEVDA